MKVNLASASIGEIRVKMTIFQNKRRDIFDRQNEVMPYPGITRIFAILAFISLAFTPMRLRAASITVGYANEPTTLDPQVEGTTATFETNLATYEALTALGEDGSLAPQLASSWSVDKDDVNWTFKLRDATFQDGTKLTASDVKASLERALAIKSAAPFGAYIRSVVRIDIIDPATVRLVTAAPDPLLAESLAFIAIMKESAVGNTPADFNRLTVSQVGTGPYFVRSWLTGDRMVMQRYDGYRGGRSPWDQVTIRYISNDAARVASLLAGDVDFATAIPPTDVARIKSTAGLQIMSAAGNRTPYIAMDQHREQSPDITDKNGKPIRNPFLDWRVRKAMSLALDRDAIVARVFDGFASKTAQIEPSGHVAHSDRLEAPMYMEYSPSKARALLAAAGYPDGFRVKLRAPATTFQSSSQYVQALAQMWKRIGVDVEPDVVQLSVFVGPWRAGDIGMGVFSYGGSNLEPDRSILALMLSKQPNGDGGLQNAGRFTNLKIDSYYKLARTEMNRDLRGAYWRAAQEAATDDVNLIETHRQQLQFGMRKGLTYHQAPGDEYFRVTEIRTSP
jgi:peptide/nickel transport system substrate-binding protein